MDRKTLLLQIAGENPWWREDYSILEKTYPHRKIFEELKLALDTRMILSLVGLRRTGKSTLMFQLLSHLLEQNIARENILYFNFDEELLAKNSDLLNQVLEIYFNEFLKLNDLRKLEKQVYIFIDEIHYVKYWQDVLKRYYDKTKKIKFIISGSFSTLISNKTEESLAGRVFDFDVSALDFDEYLEIAKLDCQEKSLVSRLETFKKKIFSGQEIEKIDKELILYFDKVKNYFEDFLLFGQFPEAIEIQENSPGLEYNYIRKSVLDKILNFDIPKVFDIDKQAAFNQLALCLLQDTSSIYEIQNLASDCGISEPTVSNYLEILQSANLIELLYSYTKSFRTSNKSLKKAYASSSNLMAALLKLDKDNPLLNDYIGRLAETYARQRLAKLFEKLSFFRKGDKEIDFLCGKILHKSKKELVFIEVKYVNNIDSKMLKFILNTLEKNELKRAIILNKNIFEIKKYGELELVYLPLVLI